MLEIRHDCVAKIFIMLAIRLVCRTKVYKNIYTKWMVKSYEQIKTTSTRANIIHTTLSLSNGERQGLKNKVLLTALLLYMRSITCN